MRKISELFGTSILQNCNSNVRVSCVLCIMYVVFSVCSYIYIILFTLHVFSVSPLVCET